MGTRALALLLLAPSVALAQFRAVDPAEIPRADVVIGGSITYGCTDTSESVTAVLLPEVERFFAGGDGTVRCYADERLESELIQVGVPPLENVSQILVIPAGGSSARSPASMPRPASGRCSPARFSPTPA